MLPPPVFYTTDGDKLKAVPIDLKKRKNVVDLDKVEKSCIW